jgi:hypothetical protein
MNVYFANVGDRIRALFSEEWTKAVGTGAQPTSIRDQSWLAAVAMARIFPNRIPLWSDYCSTTETQSASVQNVLNSLSLDVASAVESVEVICRFDFGGTDHLAIGAGTAMARITKGCAPPTLRSLVEF